MTTYDNTNRGFLRTNEKKPEQKEGAPEYRGEINVNGQEFWIAGWLAEHENMGGKYFRLKTEPKDKVFKEAKEAVSVPENPENEAPF